MALDKKVGVFAVALAAGCATVQDIPLAPPAATSLKDREITVAVHEKPDFAAMTPGTAVVGGLIGAALMIRAGNIVVSENAIEDPAPAIARALSANLQQAYQARGGVRTGKSDWDDVPKLAQLNPGSDLLLDVQTTNWTLVYFPTAWGKYRLMYVARARLVDMKRGSVLAQGMCKRIPEDSANAPTYDEFLANSAARLKEELAVAADECVRTASKQMLAISSPAVVAIARSDAPLSAAPGTAARAAAAAPPAGSPAPGEAQPRVVLASFVSTPLPDDVELSAPASGFAGVWTGKWSGDVDTALVVEQIDGRTARVVYSWGASHRARGGPDKPGFQRVDAQIADDGTLRVSLRNGATAIYQLSADGRSLSGQYFRHRYRADGTFQRRELP